jgi:hypothetical protein
MTHQLRLLLLAMSINSMYVKPEGQFGRQLSANLIGFTDNTDVTEGLG